MKLSTETLLATARLQIELQNNQLEELQRRAQYLQGQIDEMKRERRLADQAKRDAVPSLFGIISVTEAA